MAKKTYPIQDLFPDLNELTSFHTSILEKYEKFANKIDYVIAITPRSGSTALCSLLSKTEIAGEPAEFFNPRGPVQYFKNKMGTDLFSEYLESLILKYSDKSFGLKIAWNDYKFFVASGLDNYLFTNSKFIYLDRNDVAAQAVSMFYAIVTKKYHYHKKDDQFISVEDKDYDLDYISNIVNDINNQKKEWLKYFQLHKKHILKLSYENFHEDLSKAGQQVLDFLNLEADLDWDLMKSDVIRIQKPLLENWLLRTKDLLGNRN